MRESNQVRKLLIASAVIVLSIPAITSAAPEEAKSQLSLVDALNAGQATAGKAVTLEDLRADLVGSKCLSPESEQTQPQLLPP